jgi:hypothetical protein
MAQSVGETDGAKFARLILALLLCAGLAVSTRADTGEARITSQPGLLYLPMILMEAHQLIEKNANSAEELLAILNQPGVIFDVAPVGMFKLATFMVKAGTIKTQPKTWKDLFFAEAHELLGD